MDKYKHALMSIQSAQLAQYFKKEMCLKNCREKLKNQFVSSTKP